MANEDVVAALLSFFERSQQPVVSRMDRNTELLAQVSEGLKRIMDTQVAEPTRSRIIDAVRDMLNEHDCNCGKRADEIDAQDKDRAARLVAEALKEIKAGHEFAISAEKVAKQMAEEFHRLRMWITIGISVAVPLWGWTMWAFNKLPGQ